MATKRKESAQQKLERAIRQARDRAVGSTQLTVKQLDDINRQIAANLKKRIKPKMSKAQVQKMVDAEFERYLRKRAKLIFAALDQAATAGSEASAQAVALLSGSNVSGRVAIVGVTKLSAKRIRQIVDNVDIPSAQPRLARTIWRRDKATRLQITEVVNDALRAGEQVARAADRLVHAAEPRVHLPKYIREMRDAVKGWDDAGEVMRRHVKTIRKLGARDGANKTLKAAGQEILRRVDRMTEEQLERQINQWAIDKARYNAERILRTEGARSFSQGYVAQLDEVEEDRFAIKWNLSASHPVHDICDVHARANTQGLGPGVYRKDTAPAIPAHPHCLCFYTTVIDPQKDGRAQPRTSWLKSLPREEREAVMGVGRAKEFMKMKNPEDVFDAHGNFKPLWKIRGERKPVRNMGPKIQPVLPPNFVQDRESLVRKKNT